MNLKRTTRWTGGALKRAKRWKTTRVLTLEENGYGRVGVVSGNALRALVLLPIGLRHGKDGKQARRCHKGYSNVQHSKEGVVELPTRNNKVHQRSMFNLATFLFPRTSLPLHLHWDHLVQWIAHRLT